MGVDSRALLLPGADEVLSQFNGRERPTKHDRLPQEEGLHLSRTARHLESVEGSQEQVRARTCCDVTYATSETFDILPTQLLPQVQASEDRHSPQIC